MHIENAKMYDEWLEKAGGYGKFQKLIFFSIVTGEMTIIFIIHSMSFYILSPILECFSKTNN
jgi:hypothetical protein